MAVIFQADLNFMPVQDVFQWIDLNRLSCIMTVSHANEEDVVFYLDEGKIIFAASQKAGCRLGEYLVKAGVLTGPQAYQALNDSKKTGVLFTRHLVDRNMVSIERLTEVFSKLVETLLTDIFARESGAVAVSTPLPPSALNGPVSLETGRAIFDAVRVLDEIRRDECKLDKAQEEIIRRLNSEEFDLPAMPEILVQLVSLMEDETSTFQDMAKLIMTDQVLISSILRVANSSLYGGTGQIDTLQFAIVRLGLKEIRNIVTAIQIKTLNLGDVPKEQLQEILDDAMKTAFMASGLAHLCKLDPEEAFIGGLLMDLGKTVILSAAKGLKIEKKLFNSLVHARHAEIGAMIAKKWNYPESIQHLIRYHHARRLAGISLRITDMMQVADFAVMCKGAGNIDPELLESVGLTSEEVQNMYEKTIDTFNQVKSL